MKVLRLGDPHIKVTNLQEAEALLKFVLEMVLLHKVDRLEILGDLFHTHAIIRVEVLAFWNHWLDILSDAVEVVVLVGNHDMPGSNEATTHSLEIFRRLGKCKLHIVDQPRVIGGIGYVPYIHKNEAFIEEANKLKKLGALYLVSHTTYSGSKFESGMYAPDGVDPEQLHYDLLISGHIHNRQRFITNRAQTVIYPGTAKWDTDGDANELKGLWLVNHRADGSIDSEQYLDTSAICTPILKLEWKEGEAAPQIPEGARASVELIGSSEWVSKQKASLKGKASVKSKITDKTKSANRSAGKSLEDFLLNQFEPIAGVDRSEMVSYLKELKIV